MTELISTLKGIVGAEHVQHDGEARRYSVDGVMPSAVVFPGNVEESRRWLQCAARWVPP